MFSHDYKDSPDFKESRLDFENQNEEFVLPTVLDEISKVESVDSSGNLDNFETYFTNYRWGHTRYLYSKFTTGCEVVIIEINGSGELGLILSILKLLSAGGNNPEAVIFQIPSISMLQQGSTVYQMFGNLHSITLTSTYIAMVNANGSSHRNEDVKFQLVNQLVSDAESSSSSLNKFLIPIETGSTPKLASTGNKNQIYPTEQKGVTQNLRQYLHKLYSDLQGVPIVGVGLNFADVFLEELSDYLNFTRVDRSEESFSFGEFSQFKKSGSAEFQEALKPGSSNKWIMLPDASFRNNFKFVVFARNPAFSYNALSKPFDLWIWVNLLLSMTGVTILMTLESPTSKRSPIAGHSGSRMLVKWTSSFLCTFGNLVEVYVENRSSRKVSFFISAWLLTSIVLSNGYKGCIFSFLTKTYPPPVPRSAEDLYRADTLQIFARSKVFPEIGREYHKINPRLGDILFTIFNRTKRLSEKRVTKLLQNFSDDEIQSILGPGRTSMALIEDVGGMPHFLTYIKLYTSFFVIENDDDAFKFVVENYFWYGRRNFYFPIFKGVLRDYFESGIYAWKMQAMDLEKMTFVFNNVVKKKAGETVYAFMALCGGKRKGEGLHPKALKVETFYVLSWIYGGLLLLAGIILLAEKSLFYFSIRQTHK